MVLFHGLMILKLKNPWQISKTLFSDGLNLFSFVSVLLQSWKEHFSPAVIPTMCPKMSCNYFNAFRKTVLPPVKFASWCWLISPRWGGTYAEFGAHLRLELPDSNPFGCHSVWDWLLAPFELPKTMLWALFMCRLLELWWEWGRFPGMCMEHLPSRGSVFFEVMLFVLGLRLIFKV